MEAIEIQRIMSYMKECARMRERGRKGGGRLRYEVIQRRYWHGKFCRQISTERKNVPRFIEEEGIEIESFGLKAEGLKVRIEREKMRERERTNGSNDEARVRERNGE